MPKKKYLEKNKITTKRNLSSKDGIIDQVYYNSPAYAKLLAKKYGRNQKQVETIFNQYFKALKDLGITEVMPHSKIKRNIETLNFEFFNSLDNRCVLGATGIDSGDIYFRKSFSANAGTIFHEFNHALSLDPPQLFKGNNSSSTSNDAYSFIDNQEPKIVQRQESIKLNELSSFLDKSLKPVDEGYVSAAFSNTINAMPIVLYERNLYQPLDSSKPIHQQTKDQDRMEQKQKIEFQAVKQDILKILLGDGQLTAFSITQGKPNWKPNKTKTNQKLGKEGTLLDLSAWPRTIPICLTPSKLAILSRTSDKSDIINVSTFEHQNYTRPIYQDGALLIDSSDLFNEGITQLLALLAESHSTNKAVLNDCYIKTTKYAQLLYLICGASLFEDYFSDGSFSACSSKLRIPKADFIRLTALIDSLPDGIIDINKGEEVLDTDIKIHEILFSMLSMKMANEILIDLDKFSSQNEIFTCLYNSFITYGKELYFGSHARSLYNINKDDIFAMLTNSFIDTIYTLNQIGEMDKIEEVIGESGKKLLSTLENLTEDDSLEFITCAEALSKINYMFFDARDTEIHPVDFLDGKPIYSKNETQADYKRRKDFKTDRVEDIFSTKYYDDIDKTFFNRSNKYFQYDKFADLAEMERQLKQQEENISQEPGADQEL